MEVSPKPLHTPLNEMRNFMSHMVARTMKLKAGNLGGISRHVERTTDNHSNKDIDPEKSHQNYDLVQRESNLQADILNFIESEKSSTRKLRKDAVLCNEWIISSDKQFFDNLSPEETRHYFKVAKDYFAERFGEKNIRYAIVHMDEATPHMHMGVVPFDKDNKLSAKRIFNRSELIKIQDELPIRFQEAGFDIERGEKGSKSKHLSVPDYKKMQEDIKHLEKERSALEEKNKALTETVEAYKFNIQASEKEFEKMLNDIDGFKEFQDLVGQLEPRQWKAMLTSDILLRYRLEPLDMEQADRWENNLDNGKEFIKNVYGNAKEAVSSAKSKLISKAHQFAERMNPFGKTERERPKIRQKSLQERLKEAEREISRKREKTLKSKNKDDLERML